LTRLLINLLGPFQVTLDGASSRGFEYDKVRALLAYLAVEADRPHRREALAGLLWPDQPESTARNSLRTALSKLRQATGDRTAEPPFMQISRVAIQFNPDSDHRLDVADFAALLAECDQHRHRRLETCLSCARRQEAAAALYSGDFLTGFSLADSAAFETWAVSRREEWHRQVLNALNNLANYYERRGEYARAYQYAAQQITLEPWREEAHCQAMRALTFDGQRSAALAQYKICRDIVAEELGVAPAPETAFLYERIRSGSLGESPADRRIVGTVPELTTSLVGRENELAALRKMLLDPTCRLLTLTGLAGMGKTRLAQEAALQLELDFPHGAAFVPLVSVSSKQDVVPIVAGALGLRLQGGQSGRAQLFAFLQEKELLLVLDNFEQLLPETELLVELMQQAPGLVVLVTSRWRLNLQAEWVFDLTGLDYPVGSAPEDLESYSAVQLFIRRARQVERDFSISAADALPVAHICRLCEGMPLAIELAAATVRYQSCAQIAGQLQSRWQALTAVYRDLPERHQSIHAAFEHFWALLSAREQRVFSRLSVFQGGFDDEAAAQVARSSRELHALIDKSLVQRGSTDRFGMHPLIHQYAGEKLQQLGQYEETCGQHLDYFLALAEQGEAKLKGPDQLLWLNRLETEQQNMLAAITWGVTANLEGAARLAAANWLFWFGHGHLKKGRQQYEALLARKADLPASLRARVLSGCAALAWPQGDLERTTAVSEEGLRLFKKLGEPAGIVLSLIHLGIVSMIQGELDRAQALNEEALDLARTLADSWLAGVALNNLGERYREQGQYERSKSAYIKALNLHRERGDRWAGLYPQANLAQVAYEQGDLAEAKVRYEGALALATEYGDKQIMADIYNNLGQIALNEGSLVEVTFHFERALVTNQELGSASGIAESHLNLGDVAASRGYFDQAAAVYQAGARFYRQVNHQAGLTTGLERLAELAWLREQALQAVRWFAAAEAVRQRLKLPRTPVEQQRNERCLKTIRTQLDEETFSRLWAAGAVTSLDEALDDCHRRLG
jgi:predicted ATPase/DNA-binding SARP family transcriptional activator/Tfp pilus assembly protein PilF